MKWFRYTIVVLVLAGASIPAAAQAQGTPCQAQADAVEVAAAVAAPLDEALTQTLELLGAQAGVAAAEAPELAGTQADLMAKLGTIQQAAVLHGSDMEAQDTTAAYALLEADIVQLQAGAVGPDGNPRPTVAQVASLAVQAKEQVHAASEANQKLYEAVQALAACAEAAAGG